MAISQPSGTVYNLPHVYPGLKRLGYKRCCRFRRQIMAIKIEKQPSQLIKPLVPTPSTLREYRIGFTDDISPVCDMPAVLFYPPNGNRIPEFVDQLEKSLKETLTRLYPLAGRFVEETKIIDCNDQGVEFKHSKVNITLKDFLNDEKKINFVDEFIPIKLRVDLSLTDPILAIQVTMFECGGVAIGATASHKIVDASTLSTFLNEWAAMNREDREIEFKSRPGFNSATLFPARGVPPEPYKYMSKDDMLNKFVRKRISFSESEIRNMKQNITSGKDDTRRWSKVQLVSAIIWKTYIGVDQAKHDNPRESILLTPMNLRGRMASSIPKYSCGNLVGCLDTKCTSFETTKELAYLLNDSIKETMNNFSKVYHDSEEGQTMVFDSLLKTTDEPESILVVTVSSWCKFPFYEADFGFGKPIWVAPATIPVENVAILIDGPGGNGVDAYVFLQAKDVPLFEKALDVNAFGDSKLLLSSF